GWRGADVRNVLDFERHFPGAHIVALEENYRSVPAVLAVANAVVARSARRHEKTLRPTRAPGDRVRLVTVDDPVEEAKYVAGEIGALRRAGRGLDDIAVLYRSNLQARAIEEDLRTGGVPYRVFGGTEFF